MNQNSSLNITDFMTPIVIIDVRNDLIVRIHLRLIKLQLHRQVTGLESCLLRLRARFIPLIASQDRFIRLEPTIEEKRDKSKLCSRMWRKRTLQRAMCLEVV